MTHTSTQEAAKASFQSFVNVRYVAQLHLSDTFSISVTIFVTITTSQPSDQDYRYYLLKWI